MNKEIAVRHLKVTLKMIAQLDPSRIEIEDDELRETRYGSRNELVHDCVYFARKAGYDAGYVIHDPIEDLLPNNYNLDYTPPIWDVRWGVVAIINLPNGQISWHMDSGELEYNGHTDGDKWGTLHDYISVPEEVTKNSYTSKDNDLIKNYLLGEWLNGNT